MILSLIWAMDDKRLIGKNNALPWHISEDLKNFKAITLGKPVVMGRLTYESLGRPLPGRKNIVISRTAKIDHENVSVFTSIEEALSFAETLVGTTDEVIVMGGAQIYAQTLTKADKLYVSRVKGEFDGDAYFPEFDWTQFTCVEQNVFDQASIPFTVEVYTRNPQ